MRPTQFILNASKKKPGVGVPVELTPLFFAMGVAIASGCWFTYKKFAYDTSLRVGRTNPDRSGLKEVLESAEKSESSEK
ncbi:LAMI_0H13498g1_1 [Lachancea mirantina]|uniref:LAMI_0H13498g1_1 n=1 Tax=Lachancea mirantina TaxID=1230905 RepID=A0A1G4KHR9_9SACH|nr:LAMI_0H13498g1_1 [Lachancea mirantina]